MRKPRNSANSGLILALIVAGSLMGQNAFPADAPAVPYSTLSGAVLERAQNDLEKIRFLVEQGTLPKSRLVQAEAAVADARDETVLAATLYGDARVQDMTPAQAQEMVAAAKRRLDRQSELVKDRQKLYDSGILARSELASYQAEADTRARALELAENRAKLVDDLRKMALVEQQLERAAQNGQPHPGNVMIRYAGDGAFTLADVTTLSKQFEKHFHRALPISALGQTLVHQAMGLDHRNRVDVALSPDEPEGLWLRGLLESLHVPYLAFRSALAGAATAPHIHIGQGSTRLKLASR